MNCAITGTVTISGASCAVFAWRLVVEPAGLGAAVFSREIRSWLAMKAVIKRVGQDNRLAYGHTLVDMIAVRKGPGSLI
jgi:hypothetical protein